MERSEVAELKDGDQVRYLGDEGSFGSWPKNGTVLTRKSCWMDDEHSSQFTWIDKHGRIDYHFFVAEELEFV